MTAPRRAYSIAFLGAWAALVGWLTFAPGIDTPPLTLGRFLCIGCARTGMADIVLNWLLFIPGGAVAATLITPLSIAVVAGLGSAFIELCQIGIPGRDPALQDIVFNTLGALTGAFLCRRGVSRSVGRVVLGVAMLAWLSPIVLMIPRTVSTDLHGLWTPALGGLEQYDGRVLSASIDELAVLSRRIDDKRTADDAIRERRRIRVDMVVGRAPRGFAPIFQIGSDSRIAVFTLGVIEDDLIVRGHTVAQILRMDRPDSRWQDAMSTVAVGDTVEVVIDPGGGSLCISLSDRQNCDVAPSLAEGWGLLLSLDGAPRWARATMTWLWPLAIGLLIGLVSAGPREAGLWGAGLVLAGFAASIGSPDVRPDLIHGLALLVGAFAGTPVRALLSDLRATSLAGTSSLVPEAAS